VTDTAQVEAMVERAVRTLEERINGCMERSMIGKPRPLDGPEMKAMLNYIKFISASEPVGTALDGRGAPALHHVGPS
jgi:thiosulfate dehydrogenase